VREPAQRAVIDYYLREENRVLREQLGPRRLRFTDTQRRRLAVKAKTLGRRVLRNVASIVTPDTLLAAPAIDREAVRREDTSWPGRPLVAAEIRALTRWRWPIAAEATRVSKERWRIFVMRSPAAPSPASYANTGSTARPNA